VRRLATEFGGCSAGLTYAGLTAAGDLLPCVPAPIELGNLLEEDLEEIWTHNKLLNYIRDRKALKGSCKLCVYSGLCGGCRYTAFATRGDWLGPDTSCPFGKNPYTLAWSAANGEIIASSEAYESKEACKEGMQSVKTNASSAEIVDKSM
jgi:radical SAM protein with 4Fe4S-binding SPASM domain